MEDDGQVSYREIDLTKDTTKLLDTSLSFDFNSENASEVIYLRVERVTSKSTEYTNYVNNPYWRIGR